MPLPAFGAAMGGGGLQSSASSSANSTTNTDNQAAFSTGGINFGQQAQGSGFGNLFSPTSLGIIAVVVVGLAIIKRK